MSGKLTLKLACWDYDRTRPLIDGRVRPDNIDLQVSVMRPREAFTRMLEREEFDVAEVSLANFVQLKASGDRRFVGIPVALSRMFRHSCIYVRSGSGIKTPEDLIGRRIGVAQLDSTGIVFIKGMLANEYGVTPDRVTWVIGGLETPTKPKTPPNGHGKVEALDDGETLLSAFKNGLIDVIISNHIPSMFHDGAPLMQRLFKDFKSLEQHYFRRTGLFPIMHTVAMRTEVHNKYPEAALSLFNAFCKARDHAIADLYDTDALRVAVPWLIDAVDESRRVLGQDYWSYGIESNREVWEALTKYLVQQKLTQRAPPVEELFVTG